jgi:NAD-dependent dihydropyrimidine dehydrogenase PreA subunit
MEQNEKRNEQLSHLAKYLCTCDDIFSLKEARAFMLSGKNKVDEHSVIEQRQKQAGVSSFTRYVIEIYGLRKTFDCLDDARECFEACVHYCHNANLWLAYETQDGKLFVCDRDKGFDPLYRSCFACPFGRGKFAQKAFEDNLREHGFE